MHSSLLVLAAVFASVMASPQLAVSSPVSVSSPLPPTTPISSLPSGTRTTRPKISVLRSIYIPKTTSTGLPLGVECNRKVVGSCANGVECYATNVLLKPRCGNYKSRCSTDAQCAYHHCVRDMCQGFKKVNTTRPYSSTIATGGPVPTNPSGSGTNSSATLSRTGSTPTGPAQANEVARIGGSLAGLLALAALVALAL